MDPREELAALRRLAELEAKAKGAPERPQELGGGQGMLRQFAHGAAFGFDDELAGAASALTGGDYQSAKDAYAAERDRWREENPGLSIAGNVAGGVASGIGAGGAAAATKGGQMVAGLLKTLPRWGQLATAGGAAGALQGAGDAEEGGRLAGAGTGAAVGAVTGAILPPVVGAAARGVNTALGTAGRWAVNAMRTPEQQGVRLLAKALARDEMSPTQLEAMLAKRGPQSTIADAGGANVLGLADFAAQQPGIAKNAGMAALEDRAKGAGPRVMQALQGRMGVASTDADAAVMQLHQNMRDIAAQHGYDRILDTGAADATGNLEALLQTPTVRGALGGAYRDIADEVPFNQAARQTLEYFDVGPDGAVNGFKSLPSLRALDYVKRTLDGLISDGTDPITGKLSSDAVRALRLKNGLLKTMDSINPEYGAVRAAYADEKAGETALKMGRAFLADDAEVTARHVADMTPAERQYFKLGVARAVRDKILGAPDTGMAYQQFINRPATREKLAAAFGDDKQFAQFMAQLDNEVHMGKTFASLRGNSKTAARAAVAQDAGSPIAGESVPVTKEGWARKLAIALTKPSDEVSGQLSDALLTQDPARKMEVLKALRALGPTLGQPVPLPALPPNAQRLAAALLGQQAAP